MSTKKTSAAPAPADDPRRAGLLEAAMGVFARYGYRKTSMDEVARAAQISRQGLYLHFANKEDLFRATAEHMLASSLLGGTRALEAKGTLPERLQDAFDEWMGRHVGVFASDASDLIEAAEGMLGTVIREHEDRFLDRVAAVLRESGLMAAYKPTGLTARQLAANLDATAVGLKHMCTTRDEFRQAFAIAVRVTCAPLALAPAR